ncbi:MULTISPECIES: adenosylmethionine--8-amino-7-oxononanoate transaminase [Prauserella salsuginis group]|uniref:Adenosylmethionine-8-amino-7-oxononanoate aminotransferase n=1 Tax=Prauserella salsuginis TaxID=387889 RepID=A0ABW6GAL6_9PSEU|nr:MULTISPECIES: adenosylmethionine--8-amino-7-oxononanoate transaminase [Prauserella salsuginis group]MCR3722903.1 adenosylmethionine-8-amino-7-oxononanoate aminotransferase [Prauserella flava]MCR3737422.1 adenosylmethionine-8-amino-7-oxononanoate aminotransferase [Prauserella salsuginis]
MTAPAEQLLAFDREHLWHPYTSMTGPAPVRLVTGAAGSRITLDGVGDVVDGMASWWSAIHGYRHPVLDEAAHRQLDRMSHVMFGGLTHDPAIALARRLVDLAPGELDRVFLADSGSVSIEVAMKMALQYQRGSGRPQRSRFLTVRGGYHGDTFDCMSVCDPTGGMHSMWSGLLPQQVFGERPPPLGGDVDAWAEGFRALAARHRDELAGLIVEPLLQGAGGMHPYPAECLSIFREVADEHGLVLIFDEIATGFGRTGTFFAADAAGVAPDVMCVGKALTGGYLSLAATLCTADVARGVSASDSGVLMHGPTFMGNPLACAIATASLDLLTERDWTADVRRINAGLQALHGIDCADVRVLGAVGVVQLDHDVDVPAAAEAALARGVWLRPFRDLIYTMPPYVCTDEDIATICAGIAAAAEAA